MDGSSGRHPGWMATDHQAEIVKTYAERIAKLKKESKPKQLLADLATSLKKDRGEGR